MKRLKQLSLILFISVGLFSCEAEKADADITNEFLTGKQIFRCDVDGKTRVTDSVVVSYNGVNVSITAYLLSRDTLESQKFRYDTFTINFSKLGTGNYISSLGNVVVDETLGISNATYRQSGKSWVYSTDNLDLDPVNTPSVNLQTGNLIISDINDKAKYFGGEFEYDIYPPKRENPNNTVAPVRIRNGAFQYLKYD